MNTSETSYKHDTSYTKIVEEEICMNVREMIKNVLVDDDLIGEIEAQIIDDYARDNSLKLLTGKDNQKLVRRYIFRYIFSDYSFHNIDEERRCLVG
jgi:hypothetical protein